MNHPSDVATTCGVKRPSPDRVPKHIVTSPARSAHGPKRRNVMGTNTVSTLVPASPITTPHDQNALPGRRCGLAHRHPDPHVDDEMLSVVSEATMDQDLDMFTDQLLADVDDTSIPPEAGDVLCGRGGFTNRNPGNAVFRQLVRHNKDLYRTGTPVEKRFLPESIVLAILGQNRQFLKKDESTGLWTNVGTKEAIIKTRQALREGNKKEKSRRDIPVAEMMPTPAERTIEDPSETATERHTTARRMSIRNGLPRSDCDTSLGDGACELFPLNSVNSKADWSYMTERSEHRNDYPPFDDLWSIVDNFFDFYDDDDCFLNDF